jgi:hypothetical protein
MSVTHLLVSNAGRPANGSKHDMRVARSKEHPQFLDINLNYQVAKIS